MFLEHTTFSENIPLDKAVLGFITAKKAEGKSQSTIEGYKRACNRLLYFLAENGFQNLYISDLTREMLREFIASLQSSHNTGGVGFFYRNIKVFLRWHWYEYDLPIRNPIEKVKIAQPKVVPRHGLPLETIERLYLACNSGTKLRDRAIIYGLLDSCARATEFCNLKIHNLDFDTGIVDIEHGKGDKFRRVRFGTKSLRCVRKYLNNRSPKSDIEPLFHSTDGGSLTRFSLRLILDRRADDAGIPHVSIHDFRRRGAYELWRKTRDIRAVSIYLGHSNVTVTQRYIGITDDDIISAHTKGSPVDNYLL